MAFGFLIVMTSLLGISAVHLFLPPVYMKNFQNENIASEFLNKIVSTIAGSSSKQTSLNPLRYFLSRNSNILLEGHQPSSPYRWLLSGTMSAGNRTGMSRVIEPKAES
jgi:hypothetical protein